MKIWLLSFDLGYTSYPMMSFVWTNANCFNTNAGEYQSNNCTSDNQVSTASPFQSFMNSFNASPTPYPISEYCARNRTGIYPHQNECQAYYNCSMVYDTVPEFFEQHLEECLWVKYSLLTDCKFRFTVWVYWSMKFTNRH